MQDRASSGFRVFRDSSDEGTGDHYLLQETLHVRTTLLGLISQTAEYIASKKKMVTIREINPSSDEEIDLVASRMRQTLIEVLGEEKGDSLYSFAWLRERVLWHLDPDRTADIFVAEDSADRISGHAIVRIEQDEDDERYGHFSTIYVEPGSRNLGIATQLINRVEEWCREKCVNRISYNRAENNHKRKYSVNQPIGIIHIALIRNSCRGEPACSPFCVFVSWCLRIRADT